MAIEKRVGVEIGGVAQNARRVQMLPVPTEAAEEPLRPADIVVNSNHEGILKLGVSSLADKIVSVRQRVARQIGLREILHEVGRDWIDTAGRNHIARERVADKSSRPIWPGCERVENSPRNQFSGLGVDCVNLGEIALLFEVSRYGQEELAAGLLPKAFVAAEEECLVAYDVAASCGAKLVLLEFLKVRSASVGEEIIGIQFVIAEKLPACSVQVVRA